MTLPAYALPEPALMTERVKRALPQFHRVNWVETTASTNADLLALARTPDGPSARPWLLGAHTQERGRGRSGRTWQNRRGANLMFSCAFDIFLPARQLPTLSPYVGMLACNALRGLLSAGHRQLLTMKWPNDLQWSFAKLAGILVEATRAGASQLSPDHHIVIIGIGVNLDDARALSQSLNRQIADWQQVCQADPAAQLITPDVLVAHLARAWYTGLNHVTAYGFTDFPEQYAQVDALAGQSVQVLDDGQLLQSGIAAGISPSGELLLRTPRGETAVTMGDISVRARTAN
jgi:BirA family biotin operon repressor/biotin-[acetyl-CoA-carboxylase] ligase